MGKKMLSSFHIHLKLAECFQRVSGQYIQFNYFIKSRESAKNRPVLEDLLDNCKLYLVQAKVELLQVLISKPPQSTMHALRERKLWRLGSHFLSDYMDKLVLNADKNEDKRCAALANPAIAWDYVAWSTGLESAAP